MHVSRDRMADYLAGLLQAREEAELEEHLFSCHECATDAEPLFGLAAEVRQAVPPVLTTERFARLEGEDRIGQVNPMSPGQKVEVRYPEAGKILVHRLAGAELARAQRVDVEITDLDGKPLLRFEDVPFDPVRGEVLVACQRHFADLLPDDAIFRLEAVSGGRREEASRYTVLHRL